MVALISPFRGERQMARELFGQGEFLELYVDTPLEICEARDPKGLYRKARAGQLVNFTGIDSPYEPPEQPDVQLCAGNSSPEDLVQQIIDELGRRELI
jgi:bifunctional enzyme CysN/CysC